MPKTRANKNRRKKENPHKKTSPPPSPLALAWPPNNNDDDNATEMKRLREENLRLREALHAVAETAAGKTSYYYNLVWRSNKTAQEVASYAPHFYPEMQQRPDYAQYKQDEAHLTTDNAAIRFYHEGFYSGCYASARLFLGLTVVQDEHTCEHAVEQACPEDCLVTAKSLRQQALDDFPLLDT